MEAAQVGKAVVRKVVGSAEYSEGGVYMPLKVGMELSEGTVVRTANEAMVLLFLDQNGPLLKLSENTTVSLDKLSYEVTGVDTVIETQLDVKSGRVVGIVKKLAATSKYEVKFPNGVAGIRGTEYVMTAAGDVYVVDGSVVVVVVADGVPRQPMVVNAGEWFNSATGAVEPIPPSEMNLLLNELAALKGGVPIITVDPEPIEYVSPIVGGDSED
jgi:hypothetical protein